MSRMHVLAPHILGGERLAQLGRHIATVRLVSIGTGENTALIDMGGINVKFSTTKEGLFATPRAMAREQKINPEQWDLAFHLAATVIVAGKGGDNQRRSSGSVKRNVERVERGEAPIHQEANQ